MTLEERKRLRDKWCEGKCDVRMTYVHAGKDIGSCLYALDEAEEYMTLQARTLTASLLRVADLEAENKKLGETVERVETISGKRARRIDGFLAKLED